MVTGFVEDPRLEDESAMSARAASRRLLNMSIDSAFIFSGRERMTCAIPSAPRSNFTTGGDAALASPRDVPQRIIAGISFTVAGFTARVRGRSMIVMLL